MKVINTGCTVASMKLSCTHVAVGSFNASAMLWTLATSELQGTYIGHTSAVFAVNFDHFFDIVITGSADNTVIFWSLVDETPLLAIPDIYFQPSSMQFVRPSEILHQSTAFMLVASNRMSSQCRMWFVNFCGGNIVVSDVRNVPLPSSFVSIHGDHEQVFRFGADVISNEMLFLASSFAYVWMFELCLKLKCCEDSSASSSVGMHLSTLTPGWWKIVGNQVNMLLAAGTSFNVYMTEQYGSNEFLLMQRSSSKATQCVGCWNLPVRCR